MANLNLTQEKLAALRSEYKFRNVRGKYPRQKMLPEYRCIYPWVLPDETDPYYTFCTVCECRLSAKRSDLGKHEGSIKHTENATKKGLAHSAGLTDRTGKTDRSGLVLKGSLTQQHHSLESSDSAAEITVSDADEDDREEEDDIDAGICIKHEPAVDLIDPSSNAPNYEELNSYNPYNSQDTCLPGPTGNANEDVEGDYEDDDDEDDYDDDNDNEGTDESCTPPPAKRSTSESDSQSQHSSKIKLCAQIADVRRRISISKTLVPAAGANIMQSAITPTTAQAPCKITIKKITTPISTALQPNNQATSMATTITPVPSVSNGRSISKQQSPAMPLMISSVTAPWPTTSQVATTPAVRDAFDLFFESICATVKSLPPKLATEGKMRVMQLIGELEIRAIAERESSQSRAICQQNSTVVSTTK